MSSPSLSPPDQPEHAPPQQDKPSLPVMSMHTDYQRAESTPAAPAVDATPSKPTSPVHASLYAQLQAAHAKEGTGAAAAILLARSQELLGVSQDPNALVDSATRTRLANEGAELQAYADLLIKTPQAEAISTMWTNLADKYSAAGSGLQNEALNLWTQLYSSNEAKELGDASSDLIRQWQAYAATTEGHQMLETSTNLLKSQSGVLAHLLQGFTASVLAPAAGDAAAAGAAVSSSADGAPGQALLLSPTAMASSAAMMKATQKVNRALADDEDVKELMARGSNLLKSYSADPLSKSASPMPPGAKSPSAATAAKSPSSAAGRSPTSKSSPSASSTSTSGAVSAPSAASVASDAAGAALATGAEYLKSLRESEVGNKMLAKAAVMLQANKDLLTPAHLTSLSSSLKNDADQRQQFITRTKDIALDFLLSYLPSVVVPPIVGEKDKIAYEIGNIDLGSFKVDSENVVVTVDTRGAIEVRATNITCAMKNLLWAYKKLSFPKLSGKGTADAHASEVEFVLKLKIAFPNKQPEEKLQAAPAPAAAAASASSSPPAAASSSSKKSALSAAEAIGKSQAAAAAHPPKSHTAGPTEPKQPQQQQQHATRSEKESAASTSAAAAASSAGGASDARLPVAVAVPAAAVSSVPSSLGGALLSTVSMDLGRPRLVMESCHITLKQFDLRIHTGFFKSAYNLLLTLFKDSVRRSLESKLNLELVTRSVFLLDTLNALAVDYLPILQRIAIKASTAAMAEDAPDDTQTPTDDDTTEAARPAAAAAAAAGTEKAHEIAPAAAAAAPPTDADTAALEDFYGVKK